MEFLAHYLPHVNASLNLLATVLLVLGGIAARNGAFDRHRKLMLTCFGISALFLACYVGHKFCLYQTTGSWNRPFPKDPTIVSATVRNCYLVILLTHLVLAMLVPPLAIGAIYFGLKDHRTRHRKLVRFAWPIWFYVSVTGVVVYFMLYHVYA
jgi:uncharacterized membrane protein YozB (DUF420 family)